jgi:hypothetical protein
MFDDFDGHGCTRAFLENRDTVYSTPKAAMNRAAML